MQVEPFVLAIKKKKGFLKNEEIRICDSPLNDSNSKWSP